MAWLVSHVVFFSPVVAYSSIPEGCTVFYHIFYISIHVYPLYRFACKQPSLPDSHVVGVKLAKYLHLLFRICIIHLAFMAPPSIMSDGQVFLYVLCHVICFVWQPCMIYALKSVGVHLGLLLFCVLHACAHW